MSLRIKLRILLWLWMIGGSLFSLCILYISHWFIVPLLILFLVVGVGGMLLKCPQCHRPATYNPINLLGLTVWMWTPWIPIKCSKCRNELK
jgi:hypothetical protein